MGQRVAVIAKPRGLESLDEVSAITISGNPKLERVDGLAWASTIGTLLIEDNPSLVQVDLASASTLDTVSIIGNSAIEHLDGFSSLTSIGRLTLGTNAALRDLTGLGGVASMGSLRIIGNPSLQQLDDLASLTSITYALHVHDNVALPQCLVDEWALDLTIGGEAILAPNGPNDACEP